jgi:hypothetical protein
MFQARRTVTNADAENDQVRCTQGVQARLVAARYSAIDRSTVS